MTVPFFRYPHVVNENREEILAAMMKVVDRGAFIHQEECREFEKAIGEFIGVTHALGTANATDSLTMALMCLGIKPGDEVILPSHTFIATAAAVKSNGGVPILCECDENGMMDPSDIEHRITAKTRFLMPVQLNGQMGNMDPIMNIADQHGLMVVEDSSQGLGSRYKGKHAGTFGRAGVLSFYPAKLIGCFGDGGLLMTNDDQLAENIRLVRDHGRGGHGGEVEMWGINSRLDTLHAAVLSVKLAHYPAAIKRRREIAGRYHEGLCDLKVLDLPRRPVQDGDYFDVYQNYELRADRRDELRAYLTSQGIGSIIQWGGKAIHQFPALGFRDVKLPRTEAFFKRCFLLPMNTSLTDDEVAYTVSQIRKFYGK